MIPTVFGIVKIRFFPRLSVSVEFIVNASPAEYPDPPLVIVAATATPEEIERSIFAFCPNPVSDIKLIFEYTFEPLVNPEPTFVNVKVEPIPTAPTRDLRFEVKLVLVV